jgi:hypothetical protein
MKKNIYITLILFLCTAGTVQAQHERTKALIYSTLHGWEYGLKAGVNIGGTSPLPLPQEIRSLDAYSPGLAMSIEGNATKWFGDRSHWGITLGIRLESKHMTTRATTKNYNMKLVQNDGGELEGLWTGGVKTKVKNAYLTIPILANYKISKRWKLVAGPYVSYLIDKEFSGYVYDGQLRKPDAAGNIGMGDVAPFEGKNIATYDFSDDLRRFAWGVQLGTEWRAFKRLSVHADLDWGLNGIFKSDFETITFAMYPIYLNVGFGYAF